MINKSTKLSAQGDIFWGTPFFDDRRSGDMGEVEYIRRFNNTSSHPKASRSKAGTRAATSVHLPLIDIVTPQPKTSRAFFAKITAPKPTSRRTTRLSRSNVSKKKTT